MAIERMDPRIDEHRVLYTEHIVRYVFAASYVEGKRVLDVGSGAGYGTGLLGRAGASSVVGVEIDHETAAHARYDYLRDGTAFVTADATFLPFPDASFDVVTCFEVIEHVNEEQQRTILREVRRVLAPEGIAHYFDAEPRTLHPARIGAGARAQSIPPARILVRYVFGCARGRLSVGRDPRADARTATAAPG